MMEGQLVTLEPRSVENARWLGDLQMLYNGQLFSGDALVNHRCKLVQMGWQILSTRKIFQEDNSFRVIRYLDNKIKRSQFDSKKQSLQQMNHRMDELAQLDPKTIVTHAPI